MAFYKNKKKGNLAIFPVAKCLPIRFYQIIAKFIRDALISLCKNSIQNGEMSISVYESALVILDEFGRDCGIYHPPETFFRYGIIDLWVWMGLGRNEFSPFRIWHITFIVVNPPSFKYFSYFDNFFVFAREVRHG